MRPNHRDFVSSVMHEQDPEGFNIRSPAAKKIQRFPKCPIGINERWAGDGHDKLNKIGIAIWAVVDDATSKWLGAWAVPNNRLGAVVAYLALSLIEEIGGRCSLSHTYSGVADGCSKGSHSSLPLTVGPKQRNCMVS